MKPSSWCFPLFHVPAIAPASKQLLVNPLNDNEAIHHGIPAGQYASIAYPYMLSMRDMSESFSLPKNSAS